MGVMVLVTLMASIAGSALKNLPVLSMFGALIIALLLGMAAQFPIRRWYERGNPARMAGVRDAAGLISNKLLRLGIILLGFKLNLQVLFTKGLACLPIAAVVVTFTIVVTYAIARAFHVDPMLAMLVAGGTGICGAAAVMGLSSAITVDVSREEEKQEDIMMAVAAVAMMGTIFALVEIVVGPLTGLSAVQLGVVAGASLHEIAHAVAAGAAFGSVEMATIMKLSRVLMLVVASIVIALWWDRTQETPDTEGRRHIMFPWFMLGFVGASMIGSFVPGVSAIAPTLVDVAYVVLGMAMAALGITVNFRAIADRGRAAFLSSFIASVLLLGLCVAIAAIVF